jgi:hypothetical protein
MFHYTVLAKLICFLAMRLLGTSLSVYEILILSDSDYRGCKSRSYEIVTERSRIAGEVKARAKRDPRHSPQVTYTV